MIYEPKEILLKDGRKAVFRSPLPKDAAALLVFLREICAETDNLLRMADECTETVEQELMFITNLNAASYAQMIICEIDGEIAGNCQVTFNTKKKIAHRAEIALGIRKKYWNLGIGKAFFAAMEETAREYGAELLELSYIEGNERGRILYEKCGFKVVAERPNAFLQPDGHFAAEIMMQKKL